MCGIFGCFLTRPLTGEDIARLRHANASLAHRGPDGEGDFADAAKGMFIGHRRLSIIDLSDNSSQPMQRDDHVLSYNGELYNFRDLASELQHAGIAQRTTGDTEILLQSWMRWGKAALGKFDGMFAFALFDGLDIHLVTDPFGEKPLYAFESPDGVYFASEPGPIGRLVPLKFQPSDEDIAAFFSLGFLPAPRTGIPGLHRLPPATHVIIRNGRIVSMQRYWRPAAPRIGTGQIEPVSEKSLDAVESALVTSLERRLIADVPVGLFLSGGTDSVLLAALLSKVLKRSVSAITVAFPDGADESALAAKIADHLGLPHRILDSRADESWKRMPEELWSIYGDLIDNPTALSVRQMCRAVRDVITVAISGIGGDELFFGYQRYAFLYEKERIYERFAPIVDILRPLLGERFDVLPAWKSARTYIYVDPAWQYLAVKNGAAIDWLRSLKSMDSVAGSLFHGTERRAVYAARQFDLEEMLPSNFIPAVERGSMQASLEVRTPYLSRDLYAAVADIDQRALIASGRKSIAFALLRRYLPDDLIFSRKQGFVLPKSRYFAQDMASPANLPIGAGDIEKVWSKRTLPNYQDIALRMQILSAAYRSAA